LQPSSTVMTTEQNRQSASQLDENASIETESAEALIARLERVTFSENVPLDQIITAAYCRPLKESVIRQRIAAWDDAAANYLVLSLRESGLYAIIDGNHRRVAAMRMGRKTLPARVFIDLTYEREAELFNLLNTQNRPSALDRFIARLEAGERKVIVMNQIIQRYGLSVGRAGRDGQVSAVAEVEKVYEDFGADALNDVFRVITKTWGMKHRGLVGNSLRGFAAFFRRYKGLPQFDEARLVRKLKVVEPEVLIAKSNTIHHTMGYDSSGSYGRAILGVYNTAIKEDANRLPEWKDRVAVMRRSPEQFSQSAHKGWTTRRRSATGQYIPNTE
jgi:hypothetical protein